MSRALLVIVLLQTTGCLDRTGRWRDDDDDDWGTAPSNWESDPDPQPEPSAIAGCEPSPEDLNLARSLYAATDQSIHELVTCGGLQMALTRSFVVSLIVSNAAMVTDEAEVELGALRPGFSAEPDGTYVMSVGDDGRSRFALRFFDGDTEPLVADVFRLDSYLAGVRVDASLSFAEMRDDPTRPCRFSFRFDGPGPLAHLLNDGQPLSSPFIIDLTLRQAFSLLWGYGELPSLGPFDSLLGSLEVESELDYVDDRGEAAILYTARGPRASMRSALEGGQLAFEIPAIESTQSALSMRAETSEIRYLSLGTLAGSIDFALQGPDVSLRVVSDFGDGLSYPQARWSCP